MRWQVRITSTPDVLKGKPRMETAARMKKDLLARLRQRQAELRALGVSRLVSATSGKRLKAT